MIKYIIGDATKPIGEGKKIIAHICNDVNAFGAGFVVSLTKRWSAPKDAFHESKGKLFLGDVQFVNVEDDIIVANMIAQEGIGNSSIDSSGNIIPPIRYGAVRVCLSRVNELAMEMGATIHAPRFGSGLAGGKWNEIEKIINETVAGDIYIYDLK